MMITSVGLLIGTICNKYPEKIAEMLGILLTEKALDNFWIYENAEHLSVIDYNYHGLIKTGISMNELILLTQELLEWDISEDLRNLIRTELYVVSEIATKNRFS